MSIQILAAEIFIGASPPRIVAQGHFPKTVEVECEVVLEDSGSLVEATKVE